MGLALFWKWDLHCFGNGTCTVLEMGLALFCQGTLAIAMRNILIHEDRFL
jgi:hypothetical protein